MKALKILGVLLVVIVLGLAAGVFWLNRYVQSDGFKQTVLDTARQTLGSDVKINDLRVSLFSGAELRGVTLSNPPGFDGNLLSADEFVLRYQLMPLLKKKLQIDKVSLVKPHIALVRNADSKWNYDALTASSSSGSGTTPSRPAFDGSRSSPLDVTFSQLALDGGVVEMIADGDKLLVRLKDINLQSTASLASGKLSGSGKATVAEINVANALFARDISSPATLATEMIRLAPISGTLAKGAVSGELALKLAGSFTYAVDIQLKDGDMATLLQEAGTRPLMTGKLQLAAALEGTGGLDTINGKGRADITGGKLAEIPALNLLAALLQIPELQGIQFEECRVEFTIGNNVMQTPVIRLKAPKIEITGKGSIALSNYSLDHQMTLAIDKSLLAKAPKEISTAFKERQDGLLAIDFTVKGPYDKPKTDLTDRLIKGATDSLIKRGFEKFFK